MNRLTLCARGFGRLVAILAVVGAGGAVAQAQTCVFNATSIPIHAEGLAEPTGNLTISCTGGTANTNVSLTMFISLNAAITNRLDNNGDPIGITFSAPPGASLGALRITSPTNISLNAVNYTVPVVTTTQVVMTLSGLRVAAAPLGATATVYATVAGVGATFNSGAQVALATTGATTSLLSSVISNGVPCTGSPLPVDPAALNFAGFSSTSTSSTIRVTESAATAFSLINTGSGSDSGARILVRLTGYGTAARVFVPDAIVGNSGTQATSGGAFSSTVGAGTYTPAANQLLLARVAGNDANGAGGSPAFGIPAGVTTFSTMTELTLTNGAASVVYEVLDSNPAVIESLQIPIYVVVPATTCPSTLTASLSAVLAPVSTVAVATKTDAIPRFVSTTLGSDCTQMSDCSAPYYPKLSVDQTPITLTGSSLGDTRTANVRVGNSGAGVLPFTTSIAYASGTNWLTVSPSSGANNVTLQIIADPSKLAEGTYSAVVTVSAGNYGSGAVPVTFTVGPVGVVVQAVGNAASFQYGTVAPGSYAVLFGLNMGGKNVSVTFNGLNATVVYASATQINLIVPAGLAGQQAASVIVTVDGLASNGFKVNLVQNAPGVFTPGIVNFTGGQVNTVTNPAARGDFVIVFLTGLAIPATGVTVNIGSQTGLIPTFAGAQGTFPALDQVNIAIPSSLPATPNPVPLQVCVPNTLGQQSCSNSVNLYIK
ncbi:MAG TPA: hypothetical protein VNH18_36090 [Bryobacteraceae bacterium]|nr:hypothetical protein [Bryobacteraceae bacterium]